MSSHISNSLTGAANMSSSGATPDAEASPPSVRLTRVVMASCVGGAMEWYDFFVYGFIASLAFDRLFFPAVNPVTGVLVVLATFSVGFIARPIGAVIFGHFGDRVGRKRVLMVTMVLMGGATTLIGLLPSYAQIGVWAPIILVICRMLQGIAVGGESIGGLLMTVESAPKDRRGFLGSLVMATGCLAQVVGSAAVMLVSFLDDDSFMSWGWRLPFLVSIVLVGIGAYVRHRVDESDSFRNAARTASLVKIPLAEVFRNFKRPALIVTLAALAETSFFYLVSIFALSYGTKTLNLPRETFTTALLIGNLLELFIAPLCGHLSDRLGKRAVFVTGLLAVIIYTYPFFLLMNSGNPFLAGLAVVIGVALVHPLMFGPEGAFFPELFAVPVRFSGVSLAKQVGTVGGGLIPVIATYFVSSSAFGQNGVVIYMVCLGLLAVVALMSIKDHYVD